MLWAQTVSFELVEPGDVLPVVIRWETEESIERVNSRWQADRGPENGEPPGELCEEAVGQYVVELLGKGFQAERVAAPESSLEVEMTGSVRAGDIISLSGRVVSKREVDGLGLVECAVVVAAQEGDVGEERVIGTGRAWVALEMGGGG